MELATSLPPHQDLLYFGHLFVSLDSMGLLLNCTFFFQTPEQTSLFVVTVSAPSAPQVEDRTECPLPAVFMKGSQSCSKAAAITHTPLCLEMGASSSTSGDGCL